MANYVLTLALETELWQEHILEKRLNIARMIYNACLYEILKRHKKMIINNVFSFLKYLSKFFIIMAMVAIGLNTNIKKLIFSGAKPLTLGFCCWLAVSLVSIGLQKILDLF